MLDTSTVPLLQHHDVGGDHGAIAIEIIPWKPHGKKTVLTELSRSDDDDDDDDDDSDDDDEKYWASNSFGYFSTCNKQVI